MLLLLVCNKRSLLLLLSEETAQFNKLEIDFLPFLNSIRFLSAVVYKDLLYLE